MADQVQKDQAHRIAPMSEERERRALRRQVCTCANTWPLHKHVAVGHIRQSG